MVCALMLSCQGYAHLSIRVFMNGLREDVRGLKKNPGLPW